MVIDGFNVLMTVEAALAGAVVLIGRDGAYRDLGGVHGTYRKVQETRPALALIGETLQSLQVGPALWLLDSPVSNSGRLAATIRRVAEEHGWTWTVDVLLSPDRQLIVTPEVIATADGAILDRAALWFPLSRAVIESQIPEARRIDLEVA